LFIMGDVSYFWHEMYIALKKNRASMQKHTRPINLI